MMMTRATSKNDYAGTLLSIGIVATRIGIHPQTLREYERQGLIIPQRTAGGTRRYGRQELARIERIQTLTAEGLSLAGVKYVLGLEDQLASAKQRIEELEAALSSHENKAHKSVAANEHEHGRTHSQRGQLVSQRTMSVEIVHIPRRPRSPRWRSEDH